MSYPGDPTLSDIRKWLHDLGWTKSIPRVIEKAMEILRIVQSNHPPTQKQLDYLESLGYSGEPPKNMAEASEMITAIENLGVTKQYLPSDDDIPAYPFRNTRKIDDLKSWADKTERMLHGQKIQWVVEPRVDGEMVHVLYRKGKIGEIVGLNLRNGFTNGFRGDDLSRMIGVVANLPQKLQVNLPELWIAGRIVVLKEDFRTRNEFLLNNGFSEYKAPWSMAKAVCMMNNPSDSGIKPQFIFQSAGHKNDILAASQSSFVGELRLAGLPILAPPRVFDSFADAVASIEVQKIVYLWNTMLSA